MSLPLRPVPQAWGDDLLSQFLQVAHENAFHVFTAHKPVFQLLAAIHATFDIVVGIAARTEPQWLAFFVTRSHSALLAAARLALRERLPRVSRRYGSLSKLRGTLST